MNIKDILDFFNSGGFLAALFILGFGVKKALDVAQVIADHTKTKKDNEVLDRIKSYARTAMTAAQALPAPGNEQMGSAKRDLIQWGKNTNYDISDSEAQKFIEEQYQLIYGQHKVLKSYATTPIKVTTNISGKDSSDKGMGNVTNEQQLKLLTDVDKKAAETDPDDYPIKLETGDLVEIDGKNMKLDTDDNGKITLTPEGK